MIDATTSDVKKLEVYAMFAKRIATLISEARDQLDREVETLRAQLGRVNDHETKS